MNSSHKKPKFLNFRQLYFFIIVKLSFFFAGIASASTILDVQDFTKITDKLGSNPGGIYKKDNQRYYLKFPQSISRSKDIAQNEVLASKLYNIATLKAPDLFLVKDGKGHFGSGSKIFDSFISMKDSIADQKTSFSYWQNLEGVVDGIAIDAWLSNWDVAGGKFDNIGEYINSSNNKNEALRVDVGASLNFSSRGFPKNDRFTDDVREWDIFNSRTGHSNHPANDNHKNHPMIVNAQKLFSNINKSQLQRAIQRLEDVNIQEIKILVFRHGPGGDTEKQALYTKLVNRRIALLSRLQYELDNFDTFYAMHLDLHRDDKNAQLDNILKFIANNRNSEIESNRIASENYVGQIRSAIANFTPQSSNDIPNLLKSDNNISNTEDMLALENTINVFDEMVSSRITASNLGISAGDSANDLSIWSKISFSSGKKKADIYNPGYKLNHNIYTLGLEYDKDHLYGIAFSHANTDNKYQDSSLKSQGNKHYLLGVHFATQVRNKFFITAQGTYGISKVSNKRYSGDALDSIISGKTSSAILALKSDISYDYISQFSDQIHLLPSIGLGYQSIRVKPYSEKGVVNTIRHISSSVSSYLYFSVGSRLNYQMQYKSALITPEISVSMNNTIKSKISGANITLEEYINFVPISDDTNRSKANYRFGTAISYELQSTNIKVGYHYAFAKKLYAHTLYSSISYSF